MDLFGLRLGDVSWFEVVFRLGSIITGLFLLLLAGLAFTRLYRYPRPAWLFLSAIGLSLVASWGVDSAFQLATQLLNGLGWLANDNWAYFAIYIGSAIVGIILSAATWWCLMLAVFTTDEPPPESDATIEEFL